MFCIFWTDCSPWINYAAPLGAFSAGAAMNKVFCVQIDRPPPAPPVFVDDICSLNCQPNVEANFPGEKMWIGKTSTYLPDREKARRTSICCSCRWVVLADECFCCLTMVLAPA